MLTQAQRGTRAQARGRASTRGTANTGRRKSPASRPATATPPNGALAAPRSTARGNSAQTTRGAGGRGRARGGRAFQGATYGAAASAAPKRNGIQSFTTVGKGLDWNERYDELKKHREKERTEAIRQGFLADPDKPRRLADAITPVGTCQDMCPEFERVDRARADEVWAIEKNADTKAPDEARMVKKFRRAAAGVDEQLPSDLRPPLVLERTLDYLINDIIYNAESLADVHYFLWDRTRAIRTDFSIQQVSKPQELEIAIQAFERITRFHILSLHAFAGPERPYPEFTAQQEREQLDKTLLSLMQYYDDSRGKVQSANEPEFRAYCILFQIQSPVPNLLARMRNWPAWVLSHQLVRTALKIYNAACNTTDRQGPLDPPTTQIIAQENWRRFWVLVQSSACSYLMACVAEIYFPLVRRMTVNAIWNGYRKGSGRRNDDWTLDDLSHALGMDDEDGVQSYLEQFGFKILEREDGVAVVDLGSVTGRRLPDPSFEFPPSNIVETKRKHRSTSAVVMGMSYAKAIETENVSADEAEEDEAMEEHEDSLFIPEKPVKTISTPAESSRSDQTWKQGSPITFGSSPSDKAVSPRSETRRETAAPSTTPSGSLFSPSNSSTSPAPNKNAFQSLFSPKPKPAGSDGLAALKPLPNAKGSSSSPFSFLNPPQAPTASPQDDKKDDSPTGLQNQASQTNPFKLPPSQASKANPFSTIQPSNGGSNPFANSNDQVKIPNPFTAQNPLFSFPSTVGKDDKEASNKPPSSAGLFDTTASFNSSKQEAPQSATSHSPFQFGLPSKGPLFPSLSQQSSSSIQPAPSSTQDEQSSKIVGKNPLANPFANAAQSLGKPFQAPQSQTTSSLFPLSGTVPDAVSKTAPSQGGSNPAIGNLASGSTKFTSTEAHQQSPQVMPKPKPPLQVDPYDHLARVLLLEPHGLLEQFIEFSLPSMIEDARTKVGEQRDQRKADAFRVERLSRRYGLRWREIVYTRRTRLKGARRRQRRQQAEAQARELREKSISAQLEDFKRSQERARHANAQPAGEIDPGSDTAFGASILTNKPAPVNVDSGTPASYLSRKMTQSQHRHSRSAVDARLGGKATSFEVATAKERAKERNQRFRDSMRPQLPEYDPLVFPDGPPPGEAPQSLYWQLRARGLDPDTATLIPESSYSNSKKRSLESAGGSPDNVRKRSQTLPNGSVSNTFTAPEASGLAMSVRDEDEKLFASVRKIREAMSESEDFYHNEVAKEDERLRRSRSPSTNSLGSSDATRGSYYVRKYAHLLEGDLLNPKTSTFARSHLASHTAYPSSANRDRVSKAIQHEKYAHALRLQQDEVSGRRRQFLSKKPPVPGVRASWLEKLNKRTEEAKAAIRRDAEEERKRIAEIQRLTDEARSFEYSRPSTARSISSVRPSESPFAGLGASKPSFGLQTSSAASSLPFGNGLSDHATQTELASSALSAFTQHSAPFTFGDLTQTQQHKVLKSSFGEGSVPMPNGQEKSPSPVNAPRVQETSKAALELPSSSPIRPSSAASSLYKRVSPPPTRRMRKKPPPRASNINPFAALASLDDEEESNASEGEIDDEMQDDERSARRGEFGENHESESAGFSSGGEDYDSLQSDDSDAQPAQRRDIDDQSSGGGAGKAGATVEDAIALDD